MLLRARTAVASLFCLYGVGFASWASRIPDVKALLGLTDPQLGAVLAWLPLGSLSALLLSRRIFARRSSRRVIATAVVCYSASLVVSGVLTSRALLCASLFCFGFSGNLLNIAINTQAVGIERRYERAMLASFHALFSIGFVAGGALGGLLAGARVSPVRHFTGIAMANGITLWGVKGSFVDEEEREAAEAGVAMNWRDRRLMTLGFIVFCGVLAEGAMIDWSAVYYGRYVDNATETVAASLTTFTAFMLIGRLGGDWLVSRYGRHTVQFANGIGLSVGTIVSILSPAAGVTLLGYALVGLSIANVVPITYGLVGKERVRSPSIALAHVATIGFFGFVSGPVLIGALSGWSSLRLALGVMVVLGMTISLLVLSLRAPVITKS